MELHRYDIIEAELDYGSGSIQKKRRPQIIVSNEKGTTNATIITVMPLTSVKKKRLPVHECLEARSETGLTKYSMILGEQPQTICKEEVIRKLGNVTDKMQRNNVNKVCFNTFFFGENINWEEVLAQMNGVITCSVKEAAKLIEHLNEDDLITLTIIDKKSHIIHDQPKRIKKKKGENLIDNADSIEYQDNEIFGRLSLYGVTSEKNLIHNLLFPQLE